MHAFRNLNDLSYLFQIKEPRATFYFKSSELFENEVYLEEVSDVLCIVQAGKSRVSPAIYNFTNVSKISGKYQLYSTVLCSCVL